MRAGITCVVVGLGLFGLQATVGADDPLAQRIQHTEPAKYRPLTAVHGGGMPDMICSAREGGSPLTGMIPMYVLMSAFHLAPWLKLAASRRNGARRS